MESILDCFGDIVGLTQQHVSDSGLYITDLEAIDSIMSISKDDIPMAINEKIESARRIAILKLHTDLTTLMMRYARPRTGFQGIIGGSKHTTLLMEAGLSGIRLVCRPIKDAEIVLKGVNTIFNATGNIDIFVASNYSDAVETINVDTVANKVKVNVFNEALVLPLHNDNESGWVEYYIYHENAMQPYYNRIKCGTCNPPFRFDAAAPAFDEFGYKQYLNIGGFNIDDLENLGTTGVNSAKGLQLNMEVRCRTDKSICRDKIDFYTNPMAMSYATAVQYKAGSVVVWDLIRSNDLNRIAMGDVESFREAAKYYERKYTDMVRYISDNMQIDSDCFCLKQKQKISRP